MRTLDSPRIVRRLVTLLVTVLSIGCERLNERQPPQGPGAVAAPGLPGVVRASAPAGVNDSYLGRPFDTYFQPIVGAGPLFPAGSVQQFTRVDAMSHEYVVVENMTELVANAHAWRVLSAELAHAHERRYASHRAYQVQYVSQVNDAATMTPAPGGAAFYLWRIHYGHSFEAVVSGDARTFHAGLAAELGAFGGDIRAFAGRNSLEFRAAGFGLTPTAGGAIFSNDLSQLRRSYTAAGPPVPIFVEYRQLGAAVPSQGVAWTRPLRVALRFDQVVVHKTGSYFSDRWTMRITCRLNGTILRDADREVLMMQKVSKGERVPLNFSVFIAATEGQQLQCELSGVAHDQGRALGGRPYTLRVSRTPSRSIKLDGGTGKTDYTVVGAIEVIQE